MDGREAEPIVGEEPQGVALHPTAFAERAWGHRPALLRMLRRLLPAPEDAEDVLQEALVHAFIGLAGLRCPESFGARLRTVAYNRAMQWQRRRYAEAEAGPRLWSADTDDGGIPEADGRLDAEAALGLLPPGDRDAVVLRYMRGWTSTEIARVQGSLAATVRWRLGRARRVLRRALDPEGGQDR